MVKMMKFEGNNVLNTLIKIIVILVYMGLLFSIATEAFEKNIELLLCAIAAMGSFYLFSIKKRNK